MVITLTPEQEQLIHSQLASGHYRDLHDLLTRALKLLIERDQANQQLEAMLISGLDSGDPINATDDWWEQKRASLSSQYQPQ